MRVADPSNICHEECLVQAGLTSEMVLDAINYTYRILAIIDHALVSQGEGKLSKVIELVNLAAVIGNLIGKGIVQAANGKFERNGPNKYPDLLPLAPDAKGVEIKMAFSNRHPKGHLPKPGYYLLCRYVLADAGTTFSRAVRGNDVVIWEIRFGSLNELDFSNSSTPLDSGKTAKVSAKVLERLPYVYLDRNHCPYVSKAKIRQLYEGSHSGEHTTNDEQVMQL